MYELSDDFDEVYNELFQKDNNHNIPVENLLYSLGSIPLYERIGFDKETVTPDLIRKLDGEAAKNYELYQADWLTNQEKESKLSKDVTNSNDNQQQHQATNVITESHTTNGSGTSGEILNHEISVQTDLASEELIRVTFKSLDEEEFLKCMRNNMENDLTFDDLYLQDTHSHINSNEETEAAFDDFIDNFSQMDQAIVLSSDESVLSEEENDENVAESISSRLTKLFNFCSRLPDNKPLENKRLQKCISVIDEQKFEDNTEIEVDRKLERARRRKERERIREMRLEMKKMEKAITLDEDEPVLSLADQNRANFAEQILKEEAKAIEDNRTNKEFNQKGKKNLKGKHNLDKKKWNKEKEVNTKIDHCASTSHVANTNSSFQKKMATQIDECAKDGSSKKIESNLEIKPKSQTSKTIDENKIHPSSPKIDSKSDKPELQFLKRTDEIKNQKLSEQMKSKSEINVKPQGGKQFDFSKPSFNTEILKKKQKRFYASSSSSSDSSCEESETTRKLDPLEALADLKIRNKFY